MWARRQLVLCHVIKDPCAAMHTKNMSKCTSQGYLMNVHATQDDMGPGGHGCAWTWVRWLGRLHAAHGSACAWAGEVELYVSDKQSLL